MNFVAFIVSLRSIVTGTEKTQSPSPYITLPENGSGGLVNYVFRGGGIVGDELVNGDIAVVTKRRRASFLPANIIRSVGNVGHVRGLEEYDASKFNIYQRLGRLRPSEIAEFYFYKKERIFDWKTLDPVANVPDAVFSFGKWTIGKGLVPRK